MKKARAPATLEAITGIEENLLPDACRLRRELAEKLRAYEDEADANHLQSPVRNLALYVSGLLHQGRVDLGGLSDLVRLLTTDAFTYRAAKLHAYVGGKSDAENERSLAALFRAQTRDSAGNLLPFEDFRETAAREVFGVVVTAHPTFAISKDLTCILAELAMRCGGGGKDGPDGGAGAKSLAGLMRGVAEGRHGSSEPVTLDDEMDFAMLAITNMRRALRRAYRILFSVAREAYPDDWRNLTPKLLTIASWVGYDLDGRADIGWADTLKKRMVVARRALEDYLETLSSLDGLEDVRGRLRDMAARLDGDVARLDENPESGEAVGAFSRALAERPETRMVELSWAIERLTQEIARDDDQARDLAVLRAEMANFGLAFAHTHVRINATQVANAIRRDIDLASSPEDPANRRRYVREINALLETVRPVTINFGSIMRERTSAIRLIMLVRQFLAYVDAAEPIRFLIAECNSAFTVLAALYFARQFGVDGKIDISPLFETPQALEQGHKIMDELLQNPHYLDYVRHRGRLCIQTGFSDAGRFMGQIPASLAIERTRIKLAGLLAAKDLDDVDLVIFDTHGESIGRGAHPVSFSDRLDLVYPPECRHAFARAGVRVKQEVSFQGGDGYVYFSNPELAFSTVCRLLGHALAANAGNGGADLFYQDSDYSLDFFLALKAFNERLMDDPDYAATLDLFGANLLYPAGSRNTRRQHEDGGRTDLEHPSQVRAIPHNAILQQLGYLSNSISGLGHAITKDQGRFAEIYPRSDRLRRLLSLAVYARHLSNLDYLHGYISLFDPTIWIRRSTVEADPGRVEQMQRLARILRHSARHEKMNRVYRTFLNDTVDLDRALAAMEEPAEPPAYAAAVYPTLTLLHGVRIALIQELFLLVARLPGFANPVRSPEDILNELLHLDVEPAIEFLRREFPVSDPLPDPETFGEVATYRTDVEQGYEREHRGLFDPIEELYDLVRRLGAAITHMMGAVG